MSLRVLRILAFLVLAFPLCSYAQSLGEVARELRSERKQSRTSHAKVITNEDIERRGTSKHAAEGATRKEAGNQSEKTAEAANPAEAKPDAEGARDARHVKDVQDPAKEREARELETEKRSEEINKVYRDRIAAIRAQIVTAQQELEKLQRDQIESSNDFQRSYGTSPNIGTYEAQQRLFNEQIEARRDAITSLNPQLEDAYEAARHAGVPHASD